VRHHKLCTPEFNLFWIPGFFSLDYDVTSRCTVQETRGEDMEYTIRKLAALAEISTSFDGCIPEIAKVGSIQWRSAPEEVQ